MQENFNLAYSKGAADDDFVLFVFSTLGEFQMDDLLYNRFSLKMVETLCDIT